MKSLSRLLLLLLSILLFACDCKEDQEEIQQMLPDPFFITSSFYDGQSEITLNFNKAADDESVKVESSLIMTPPETNAPDTGDDYYQVEFWSSDRRTLIVELNFFDSCNIAFPNGNPCPIEFRMISDKDALLSVRSANGQLLDGNRDGSDGGDFVITIFD